VHESAIDAVDGSSTSAQAVLMHIIESGANRQKRASA
jgi:hypothetical protein